MSSKKRGAALRLALLWFALVKSARGRALRSGSDSLELWTDGPTGRILCELFMMERRS